MPACFNSAASSCITTASAPRPRATSASPATATNGPKYTHAAARKTERGLVRARTDILPSAARRIPVGRLRFLHALSYTSRKSTSLGCRAHGLTEADVRPASAISTRRLGAAGWIAIRRHRRLSESPTPRAGCGPTCLQAPPGRRGTSECNRSRTDERRARSLRGRRRRRLPLRVRVCHVKRAGRRHGAVVHALMF